MPFPSANKLSQHIFARKEEIKLLIVVLVILGGFALHGYRRGLVRMVFSLAAFFLAAALASWITPYASEFLMKQTPLHQVVQEQCQKALEANAEEILQSLEGSQGSGGSRPPETIFGIKLPPEAQEFFYDCLSGQAGKLVKGNPLFKEWAAGLADLAVERAAWVISFCIVGILLGILIHALDILTKLPVINGMNHLGGVAFGLLQGLVIVWGIFFLVTLCQGSEFGKQMLASIRGNAFLQLLYEFNLLESLIGAFLH